MPTFSGREFNQKASEAKTALNSINTKAERHRIHLSNLSYFPNDRNHFAGPLSQESFGESII